MEEEELNKEIEMLKKNNKKTDVNTKDMENLIVEDTISTIVNHNKDDSEINNNDTYKKSKNQIKSELNSLIQYSEIILEVVDSRDPLSYRSKELEKNVTNNKRKVIIVLNKADLVSK
jgi:nuclear GTP-binding protein